MFPATPAKRRLTVIDRQVLSHCIEHPARGTAWSLRKLAEVIGCSHATIGHLLTGERDTVSADTAQKIADAVGVHINVLFAPPQSTESVGSGDAA